MPNYTNYATKGLIFEKKGTEGKDKVLIFSKWGIISFSMVEKSQRTNPEEVLSPVVARRSNSILLLLGQHISPIKLKSFYAMPSAYNYEFEGSHEVTPQDE